MAEEIFSEDKNQIQRDQDISRPESFDRGEFKKLLEVATHERRNLQLLAEYFEKKGPEFEQRKFFFEKINEQVPDTLGKLETLNRRIDEIKTFDVRIRDFQRLSKEMESNYSTLKRELDNLHLLSEHIDVKIKGLNQQRGLVEKANEDAGRLNVLVWDMDSKIKKLKDETKLIKNADRNINRLEYIMSTISSSVDEVVGFKELMKTASDRVGDMKGIVKELDSKFERLRQEKEIIDGLLCSRLII